MFLKCPLISSYFQNRKIPVSLFKAIKDYTYTQKKNVKFLTCN